MQNCQVGDLLVASTMAEGTILNQGVCLLVYEDDQHAIGLMLNRPMKAIALPNPPSVSQNRLPRSAPTSEASASHSLIAVVGDKGDEFATKVMQGSSLYFGGPLAGPVVAVHSQADLAEATAGEGIFVAAQRDHLESLINMDDRGYRLIVGRLGWSQDQLDNEISDGLWHRMPATAELLKTDDSLLWSRCIRRATASSVARWVGAADAISAAELN